MSRLKDETLSIRTSAELKQLLKMAAEREHRSVASMIEVLVLQYAQRHHLKATGSASPNQDHEGGGAKNSPDRIIDEACK